MNVTCPQCLTVFRVDPAKVPERGVRARCSVCSGLIAVKRPATEEPESHSVAAIPPTAAPVAPVTPLTPPPAAAIAQPVDPTPVIHVEPPVAPAATVRPAPEPEIAPPPPPREAPLPPAPPPVSFSALPDAAPVVEPPQPVEHPPVGSSPAATKFNNPFLRQDPATRARRLARALVSDLVVYHPEKRQRGLADGNLKELFGEEIRKSWEEYTEQVGEEIARTTPYFTEALNEILAEGQTLFG